MIKSTGVYIIAEAGVNHNGSLDMALQLIDAAYDAGADAVKFQTYRTDKIVCEKTPKAEYQAKTTSASETQFDMLKKLELDRRSHEFIIDYCRQKEIDFLSTPFDAGSVELLVNVFKLPCLKISSGDITNAPLLLKVARSGKAVILSTGMSTLGEVESALGVLAFGYIKTGETPSVESFQKAYCSEKGQEALRQNVVLLHCTTEYPSPFGSVNLLAMDTLKNAFGLPAGLSDHSPGIAVAIAAAARGAAVIEKHFTLDRNLPGPDHKASLEPSELKEMVRSIRQVEEALGSSRKIPAPSELKNKPVVRKCLVAAKSIKTGEVFTEDNITVKRSGGGISPMYYWDWLGRTARREYAKDEVIRDE